MLEKFNLDAKSIAFLLGLIAISVVIILALTT